MEEFEQFLGIFNSTHPTIKLKPTSSYHSINFLDVTVYKGTEFQQRGILDTKVYFKPTDTHELLHKSSYHPKHTFSGILKSQILRFHRICNQQADFDQAYKTLANALINRGYTRRFLRKIKNNTIKSLEISQNLCISKACGSNKCKVCKTFLKPNSYVGKFKIKNNVSCQSKNVIYCLECNYCHLRYVGQTKNEIKQRLWHHSSDIRTAKDKVFANHIRSCPLRFSLQENTNDHFFCTVLEQIATDPEPSINHSNLIAKETEWIMKVGTIEPLGINKREDAQSILLLILTFSDSTYQISNMFRQTFNSICVDIPRVFKSKFIIAHCRNKNISDSLISSNLKIN
jgi:hypothetical protein